MKDFITRCILFFFVLGVLHTIHEFYFQEFPELDKLDKVLDNKVDVIFFGASGNSWTAKEDTDKRSIDEMINHLNENLHVEGISHKAYHLGIYYSFLKYILKKGHKPSIIIPLHMRSFSPEWNQRPQYQFIRERNLLEFGLLHPIISNYQSLNYFEYSSKPVFYQENVVGEVGEFNKLFGKNQEEVKKLMIYFYLQPINDQHEKVIYLKKIINLGKSKNLKIFFYFPSIDFEGIEKFDIPNFREDYFANVDFLKNYIHKSSNYDVLDLSDKIHTDHFDYEKVPNEHLNMFGKLEVAQYLNQIIISNQ